MEALRRALADPAGLGGAFFQHASGLAVAHLRATIGVAAAYQAVFVGYGVVALVGLALVLFPMGPLTRDETLTSPRLAGDPARPGTASRAS